MPKAKVPIRTSRRVRSTSTGVRRAFSSRKLGSKSKSKSTRRSPVAGPSTTRDPPTLRWLDSSNDISTDVILSDLRPVNTEGHFCDLYIGTHTKFGKVALKRPRIIGIVREGYRDTDIKRFLREAQTWKQLNHPFILHFIGPCEIDDAVYLVSPFMENGTLIQFLNRNPTWPKLDFILQLAEALVYMHKADIIHGDIKGNNILISNNHHVQVTDFGLSKLQSSMMTSTTLQGAGASRWQAPELANNAHKSFESDVYAFSMTVVEMLTGTVPFPQYRETVAILRAVFDRGERPSKNPQSSPEGESYAHVRNIIELCWQAEPKDRLTMKAVVRMLYFRTGIEALESARSESASGPTSRIHTLSSPVFRGGILVDLTEGGLTEFNAIMWVNDAVLKTDATGGLEFHLRMGGLSDPQIGEWQHERTIRKFMATYTLRGSHLRVSRDDPDESILTVRLPGPSKKEPMSEMLWFGGFGPS